MKLRWIALGGVVLLIALAGWGARVPLVAAGSTPEVSVSAPAPRPRTVLPQRSRAADLAPPASRSARDGAVPAVPAPADAAVAEATEVDTGEAPPEVRGPPEVVSVDMLEAAIGRTFDGGLLDDVAECLEDEDLPVGFEGRLRLDLELGEDGLREAALDDLTGVPPSFVDCMADTVWDARWPRLDHGETHVTWPIAISMEE